MNQLNMDTQSMKQRPQSNYGGQRIQAEWGDYLSQFDWGHFCTLTSPARSSAMLQREFVQCFIRLLTRQGQQRVKWVYVIEHGADGLAHIHALLSGAERMTVDRVAKAWRLGWAQVRIYNAAAAAAYYVSKSMGTGDAQYDISPRMPQLLKATGLAGDAQSLAWLDDFPLPL